MNEEQAVVVRMIFEELLAGKSSREVARQLNADGITTKRSGKWLSSVIVNRVRNEKYIVTAVNAGLKIDVEA